MPDAAKKSWLIAFEYTTVNGTGPRRRQQYVTDVDPVDWLVNSWTRHPEEDIVLLFEKELTKEQVAVLDAVLDA
jgi:hypothetical protein